MSKCIPRKINKVKGLGHDWNNLTTLEERQFHQEVALYSFKVRKSQDGFFAGNFAGISSLIKCAGQRFSFFTTSFFGGIAKKKVEGNKFNKRI